MFKFKAGDKVKCVDDSLLASGSKSKLTKDKVYQCVTDSYNPEGSQEVVVQIENDIGRIYGFFESRFEMYVHYPNFFGITRDCSGI